MAPQWRRAQGPPGWPGPQRGQGGGAPWLPGAVVLHRAGTSAPHWRPPHQAQGSQGCARGGEPRPSVGGARQPTPRRAPRETPANGRAWRGIRRDPATPPAVAYGPAGIQRPGAPHDLAALHGRCAGGGSVGPSAARRPSWGAPWGSGVQSAAAAGGAPLARRPWRLLARRIGDAATRRELPAGRPVPAALEAPRADPLGRLGVVAGRGGRAAGAYLHVRRKRGGEPQRLRGRGRGPRWRRKRRVPRNPAAAAGPAAEPLLAGVGLQPNGIGAATIQHERGLPTGARPGRPARGPARRTELCLGDRHGAPPHRRSGRGLALGGHSNARRPARPPIPPPAAGGGCRPGWSRWARGGGGVAQDAGSHAPDAGGHPGPHGGHASGAAPGRPVGKAPPRAAPLRSHQPPREPPLPGGRGGARPQLAPRRRWRWELGDGPRGPRGAHALDAPRGPHQERNPRRVHSWRGPASRSASWTGARGGVSRHGSTLVHRGGPPVAPGEVG
mmetsp:Transcript_64592/g.145703  ORF Transcript_64592/g.145703 Transcript_64592/m.145703 type:complete len:500 (+) Transcript_64592:789-2288(+)